ncbi:MAG: HypC/HybG/HupF family hydrogenase formation chaperone [Candidatus Moranbacteria bacterium CG23_combo_of_CG06-09_8_20_14_all_39_10]|nr:MAG: HypC/HybG/HupF family hydrogenase formation chaperone [Candidatus Moranbacteria bacterium CG23_combo_of_CG06-09_8_20_14_all_39_10]
MCLAIPGKILKIKGQIAEVDFDGIKKEINVAIVDVKVGDFVMVHAGFAIEKMEPDLVADIQGYLNKDEK